MLAGSAVKAIWAKFVAACGGEAHVTPATVLSRDMEALRAAGGVRVWEPDAALDKVRAESRIWKESWLGKFFDKPCNNELFVRQSLNMEIAIQTAQREKIDWHVHVLSLIHI